MGDSCTIIKCANVVTIFKMVKTPNIYCNCFNSLHVKINPSLGNEYFFFIDDYKSFYDFQNFIH